MIVVGSVGLVDYGDDWIVAVDAAGVGYDDPASGLGPSDCIAQALDRDLGFQSSVAVVADYQLPAFVPCYQVRP